MRVLQHLTYCIMLILSGCASWQSTPTPSTLDNSLYNQNALNIILHSASEALTDKLLFQGIDNKKNYTVVYAMLLKNKPTAISIISTPVTNKYFVNLIKTQDVSATLFAPDTKIIHSDTTIVNVGYDQIHNTATKAYLNSLGFNSNNNFLKRTTYFYKNNETLTLIDYLLPDKTTNKFND